MWVNRALGALLFLISIGCAQKQQQPAPAETSKMDTSKVYCSGRFSFLAPTAMAESGRGQMIYRTNINMIDTPDDGVEGYWRRRLATIGARAGRVGEFMPGARTVWSSRNTAFPEILTFEMVKPAGERLLTVDREAEKGKEKMAEGLVRDIVDSLVTATNRGFCLGPDGALTIEPSQNEQARLSLEHAGVELRFATRTVAEPDTKTYSNVDEEKETAASAGGSVTVIAEQDRPAAALRGHEIRIRIEVPGQKPQVRFTWSYPGEGESSTHPAVTFVGIAEAAKQAELETVWESALTSLRAIPVPK